MNRQNTSRGTPTSGERNIYMRANGSYRVRIRRDGVEHDVGTFDTLDEAVAARDNWLHM